MKVHSYLRGILGAAVLCLSSVSIHADDTVPSPIGPFGTLNNRDSSYAIAADKAQDLLNVNVTQGGKSVFKRKGYGIAQTLTVTTSPVHGIYTFFDGSGNTVDLFAHDTRFSASVNGNTPTVLFSTGTASATYQCTDSLGFAYCVNTGRTTLIKTNGVTYSNIQSVSSTGTMVATCVTRLAMAGFSDRPSGIDLSADADFTTWGTGSQGGSAVQVTINAPGARVTHIVYAFGKLIWFKDTSFGFIIIGNQPLQSDWVIKTVSFDVGTNDNTSVFREGILYFRGQDGHIYAFDGSNYQRVSREISGTINLSQTRSANSWVQTTQSDFQSGAQSPAGWIDTSTVSGTIFLATAAPVSSFVDTVAADFGAGTLVNLSSASITDSLLLSLTNQNVFSSFMIDNASVCGSPCTGPYYQAQAIANTQISTSVILSAALIHAKKTGSPGDYTVNWRSDNAGIPGTTLESGTLTAASVGTSTTDVIINFSSSTRLITGTTYWLQLVPNGTCDVSNKIEWYSDGAVTSRKALGCGTSATTTGALSYDYKLYVTTFQATGNITSRSFDVGFTTNTWIWNWGAATCGFLQPAGTFGNLQTQTSTGTNGPWESVAQINCGDAPTSTVQEFIRYKFSFTTTDQSTSPVLSDLTLAMSSRLRPSATYYSAVKSAPNLTAWDAFTMSNTGTGNLTVSIRSSTNTFSLQSSTPVWKVVTPGGVPSISTATFFQLAFNPLVINSVQNPTLTDFTQNWFEGNATDKAYATYFDDKIWWSVTSGNGATVNNKILIYDLINQGWLLYDIAANGFFVRQNRLYFGGSNGGYIYKFGDIDNDAGSAINAYWKSKDFFGANPFSNQEISNISIAAKSVANSSMTVTYSLNGSSSTSYTMNEYNPNGNFIYKNRNIPGGTVANQFNVKFGNNAVDQPFEVFGIQVGIRPKPWSVTP